MVLEYSDFLSLLESILVSYFFLNVYSSKLSNVLSQLFIIACYLLNDCIIKS